MGEAKQRQRGGRRRRAELGANVSLVDPRKAMEQLNTTATVGKPMSLTLLGAGLIPQSIRDGTLQAKIMARKVSTERHLWRYAFMVWDRVRTGEYDPWMCTLCGRNYSGLRALSVLGVIDDPREAPTPNKPAAMALVCTSCDSVSTEETQRQIEQTFGLVGMNTPDTRQ
jgi:hypothetical protein